MSLDKKLFKAVATTTTTDADAPQGLVLHLDANDEDSIEQGGANDGNTNGTWFDISTHNLNIPLADKASNLQLHLNASDATSYGGSGTTWTDISGNDRDATIGGGFESTYEKDTRGYFHLDGSDAHEATVNHNAALDITSSGLTVEAWVNPDDTNYNTLVAKFSTSASIDGYALAFNLADIYWRLYTSGAGVGTCNYTTGTEAAANSWYHIVGTVSGTASGSTMKLYKNGTLLNTTTTTGTYVATTRDVKIGGYDYANGRNFDGKISTVRIYNTVLTDSEVAQNYRAGNNLVYSSVITTPPTQGDLYTTNLNLNLDANGYSGSGDWQDSANDNDGTISGATYTNNTNSDYFDFDGNDTITVSSSDLNPANTKCIEFWFNTDSSSEQYIISNNSGSGAFGYHMGVTSGKLFMWIYSQEQAHYHINTSTGSSNTASITVGEWNHAVFTMGTSASDNKIYLNGNLAYTETSVGGGTYPSTNAHNGITIGKYQTSGYFDGKIAQVRAYSTALSETQINTNYNATKALYQGVSNLVLHYDAADIDTSANTWTDKDSTLVLSKSGNSSYDKELGDYLELEGGYYGNDSAAVQIKDSEGDFSVEYFAQQVFDGSYAILGIMQSTLNGMVILTTSSYLLSYNYKNASTSSQYSEIGTPTNYLTANKWHHVVYVYDHDTSIKLYVDGILKNTASNGGGTAWTTTDGLRIGSSESLTGYSSNGRLGYLKIYKGKLTDAQVVQNYLATKKKYPNEHHATNNGATFTYASTPYYFDFDGSNDYFTIPDNSIFDLIREQSMELWLYREGTGIQYIIDKATASSSNYGWQFLHNSNTYYFQMHNAPYTDAVSISASSTVNTWEHIVVTCNGDKEWKLYKNGSLSSTDSGLSGSVARTTQILTFGQYFNGSYQFEGRIAMLKFYEKTLSSTEVTAAYNATKSTFGH